MNLEQTIRDQIISESADLGGRLDQLVRAGLMPANILPVLHRAIAKVQGGMSLQGAERDAMSMFINSMMFIVLGDDTVFNKARAGAKNYATEETEVEEAVGDYTVKTVSPADAWKKHTEPKKSKSKVPVDPKTGKTLYQKVTSEEVEDLEETAKIVAHLQKRYGDNIRKSHVRSAANDFGVGYVALSHAVRKKLGKKMLDEEEQIDEVSRGLLSRYQVASKAEGRKNRLSPSGASSKVTKRTQGADLAMRKSLSAVTGKKLAKVPATNEEVENIDELSKATMGRYVNKAAERMSTQGVTAGLKIAADEKSKKNFDNIKKRQKGIATAVKKLTKESRKTDAQADIAAIKQMNESYKTTFDAALETYGIKSPLELDEENRKQFFNFVDQNYKKGDK